MIFLCGEVLRSFVERLHDFFVVRLRDFFVERLCDFFVERLLDFLWRGGMIFFGYFA